MVRLMVTLTLSRMLVPMNSGAVQIIYDGDGNRVKRIVGYRPSS